MYVSACTYCVSSVTVLVVQIRRVWTGWCRWTRPLDWPPCASITGCTDSLSVMIRSPIPRPSLSFSPRHHFRAPQKTSKRQNILKNLKTKTKTKISYLLVMLSSLAQSNLSSMKFPSFFKNPSPPNFSRYLKPFQNLLGPVLWP